MFDDVLKEFLVKLGFKIDEAGHKKTNTVIQDITKSMNALGITIDLSLAAMTAFTVKAAEALDTLYFAGQRAGSAVANMKAFDYAVSQAGGSAAGAQATIENLGHFIRSYPGSEQFLEKLGVAPNHVHDATLALKDLQTTFQGMPFWQAQPYANLLGIDEKTLIALQNGTLTKAMDDYAGRLREVGMNEDVAAKKGNNITSAIRSLSAETQLLGDTFVTVFGDKMVSAIHILEDSVKGAALIISHPLRSIGSFGTMLDNYFSKMMGGAGNKQALPIVPSYGPSQPINGNAWDKVVSFFVSQGWTQAQAQGIAANLQRESGIDPDITNPKSGNYGLAQWGAKRRMAFTDYSGHSMLTSSMDEQLAYIQHELATSESGAAAKLRATKSKEDAAAAFSTYYERPGLTPEQTMSEARLRAGIASSHGPTVNQNTTFNISGGNAQEIATAVQGRQNDVTKDMVRNMKGAVQ